MTTIYVVTQGNYSDYTIHGCFSSEDKCKVYMRKHWEEEIKFTKDWIEKDKEELAMPLEQRPIRHHITSTYNEERLWEGMDHPVNEYYHREIAKLTYRIKRFKDNIINDVWDNEYRIEEYILDRLADDE